jgi:hypothetical protein
VVVVAVAVVVGSLVVGAVAVVAAVGGLVVGPPFPLSLLAITTTATISPTMIASSAATR